MRRALRLSLAAAGVVALGTMGSGTFAQAPAAQAPAGAWMSATPTNDLPNPYNTIEGWAKLPAGREWGSTSAVDIDKDGKSVWVAERCGTRPNPGGGAPLSTNSCWDAQAGKMSTFDPVLKFDSTGKLVKSFGAGMMVFPHGIHVDRDGNIWVTDGNDNLPRRRPGAPADAPMPAAPEKVVGHQVFKFSPDGKVLLTLGKPGGNPAGADAADPASFYQPNDVITYPNGEHPGRGRTRRRELAPHPVRQDRQVHQAVRQEGHRPRRRVRSAAQPGVRFEGPSVRGRPREQPHPDPRS